MEKNLKMYIYPERSFVEPFFKDFFSERKSRGDFVSDIDLDGRVPPLKSLGFEGGIDMCGCHLLEFFYWKVEK